MAEQIETLDYGRDEFVEESPPRRRRRFGEYAPGTIPYWHFMPPIYDPQFTDNEGRPIPARKVTILGRSGRNLYKFDPDEIMVLPEGAAPSTQRESSAVQPSPSQDNTKLIAGIAITVAAILGVFILGMMFSSGKKKGE